MTLAAIPNTRLRSVHIESEQSASRRYASFTSAVGCREWFPRSKRILPNASRRNSWYKVEVRSCPASGGDDGNLGASSWRLVAMLPHRSGCGQYRPATRCLLPKLQPPAYVKPSVAWPWLPSLVVRDTMEIDYSKSKGSCLGKTRADEHLLGLPQLPAVHWSRRKRRAQFPRVQFNRRLPPHPIWISFVLLTC